MEGQPPHSDLIGHSDTGSSGGCRQGSQWLLSWDRFGEPMRTLLFPFFLVACEQVAPSGNPLKPVSVDVSVEPSVESDDALDEEEDVFTISNEELAAVVTGEEEGDEEDSNGQGAADPNPETTQEQGPTGSPSAPAVQAEAAVAPPPPAATPGWPGQTAKAWPVRLVTTIPNASPPRAILGLPDGREVVVNPGSMVPDLGIVVVAISPNSAELAKVAPAGDHATIESMTLTAQY